MVIKGSEEGRCQVQSNREGKLPSLSSLDFWVRDFVVTSFASLSKICVASYVHKMAAVCVTFVLDV